MLFNIAASNAERVKREFTAKRPEQSHGYFQSVILTSPDRYYTYRIDMICGYYLLTVRTRDKEQVEVYAHFEQYKPESITITKGELYRNGSGYPYRTEKSDRYLSKYDQLACIVHGAISAGLLFDMMKDEPTPATQPEEAQEAHTEPETVQAVQDTTCNDTEPQEGTESRHKYGMRLRGYSIGAQPAGVVSREDDTTGQYYDIITYNRELTPEEIKHYSLTPLEATTPPEAVTAEEEPNAPETEPQRASQDAQKTAVDTITAASDTDHTEASQDPQKIVSDNAGEAANNMTAQDAQKATQSEGTTAGGQTITAERNEAQRATQSRKEDEAGKSITPPRNEPPRASQSPTEAASNAEPGRVSQSPAEAPQGQEQTAGGQRTTGTDTRPPRAAQRATTHGRTRGQPEKTANFGRFYPLLNFSRTIFANFQGIPISVCIFGPVFDPEFWSPKPDPPGG